MLRLIYKKVKKRRNGEGGRAPLGGGVGTDQKENKGASGSRNDLGLNLGADFTGLLRFLKSYYQS